jgi:hypothetical protein
MKMAVEIIPELQAVVTLMDPEHVSLDNIHVTVERKNDLVG